MGNSKLRMLKEMQNWGLVFEDSERNEVFIGNIIVIF